MKIRIIENQKTVITYTVLFTGREFTLNINPALYEDLALSGVLKTLQSSKQGDILDIYLRRAEFEYGVERIITEAEHQPQHPRGEMLGWLD